MPGPPPLRDKWYRLRWYLCIFEGSIETLKTLEQQEADIYDPDNNPEALEAAFIYFAAIH
jgi:hypothetical protein